MTESAPRDGDVRAGEFRMGDEKIHQGWDRLTLVPRSVGQAVALFPISDGGGGRVQTYVLVEKEADFAGFVKTEDAIGIAVG